MFSLRYLVGVGLLAGTTFAQGNITPTSSQVVTYPIPAGVLTNPSFNISVKDQDGRWRGLDAYLVTLNLINTTTGAGMIHNSSMAYLDFSGPIEVSLTYNNGRVASSRVRPDSYGIVPEIQGNNNIKFTMTEPRNLMVEVNGDIFNCLHLLANTIENDVPPADDENTIYFGPGAHTITGGVLSVPSGNTVYLAGGAVLNGGIEFVNVSNSVIRGRGVLYHTSGHAVLIESSNNITIDGITVLNPSHYAVLAGEASDFTIRGLRAFSSAGNGDGIDLFCCQNVLVDGVFMRNSDDNIAIYNHRWGYYGNTSNITIKDSSLWADVAHPINIGTHGNTDDPETMDGITITNIDILDHREPQMDYQGCIALNPGDSNLIQNVYIEDVRVEDFREGQLVNMRVMFDASYNTSPGRGIANVTIKNLSYNGTHANPSIFVGYDEGRTISGVTFENLVINGKQISDTMHKPAWYLASDFVPMFANEHVVGLLFNATG